MDINFSKDFKVGVVFGYSKSSAQQIANSPENAHLSVEEKKVLEDSILTELFTKSIAHIDSGVAKPIDYIEKFKQEEGLLLNSMSDKK